MRHPTAVNALAKWLILATAGLGLFLVLPREAFGPDAVLTIAGQPATAANLVGLGVMLAAWVSFLVRLVGLAAACRLDLGCRLLLGAFVVTAAGALVAAVIGSVVVLVALSVPAVLSQVAMAFRADELASRRPARVRRRLAASGS